MATARQAKTKSAPKKGAGKETVSPKPTPKKDLENEKGSTSKKSIKENSKPENKKSEKGGKPQDKPGLGPKVSKTKAGKKRPFTATSEKSKKELLADSSEDELRQEDTYSDSSLDSEDEDKVLDDLKIAKDQNKPDSSGPFKFESVGKAFTKEAKEKLEKANKKPTRKGDEGVIYIGRLPSGFEETELTMFFEQFGKINKLRLSRNRKTGATRHYAFVEFAHASVAAIAAETMNNYLVMGRLLKSQVVPKEKIHPAMLCKFKPRKTSVHEEERNRRSQPQTELQAKRQASRKEKNSQKLQSKLQASGVEYDVSKLLTEELEKKIELVPETKEAVAEVMEEMSVTSDSLPKSKKAKIASKSKRPKRNA